ncbi:MULTISPECIES: ferredoxin [unclassified Aureispira]|uniref:ferredoxin n=1 Tax=unclassified Aureispira TaxID=2649989 RepID=UPI0006971197|nr:MULTISPECIES: ferredoxin [unclassified Aureispira]WMX13075.1 ferredoxin [Aureispira sp. CCB-E]
MVTISLQRAKCIGCNYCCEMASDRWAMSKKDGKTVLIGSENKRGFHIVKVGDHEYEDNKRAEKACPVNIIKVVSV